ncbi:hypothetical protein C8K18_109116 [Paraburkholderia sp. GV068]|mgnify:CR=1 FL=1|jgi:hypothetical protein|uniref:Uncharacterized protein n=1 Tax=Paraburkholderia graminis (strain ATCC 700544 / DSM 17151 / LMG 18924 / NCIMB 13744 / C4D1M) TaxID=396598 RepID=B1G059_PARG4|nr:MULTISPECIES: hypothetical protein [Paraburkholderia]ALE57445.1 hypothetical protein AC233_23445 [Burkholderia sp. HB1]AXF10290.1 hypothetical protein CUJ91_20100 [Paraburkholderia graminis]EDT10597.1 conserved hypothetical protein [Paraburkholderia graminis C4D1M]MDR6470541.1 hypothetical protein [Paraburkholderia graminis]PTQ97253.1 hypothetical protein C8K19_109115 [Paraburkholderia sp. GV072]
MSYQNLDNEIAHLERVFGRISVNDAIPLSYWDSRLRMLANAPLVPAQQARLARLEATLAALREPEEAVCEAPGPRSKDAR